MAFTASTFTTFVWHEETLWCSPNSYSRSEKRIHLHLQSQCKEILVSSANFWIPSTSLLWKQHSIICSLFKPLPRVSYGNIIPRWVLAEASMRIFTHVLIRVSCVILTFWTMQGTNTVVHFDLLNASSKDKRVLSGANNLQGFWIFLILPGSSRCWNVSSTVYCFLFGIGFHFLGWSFQPRDWEIQVWESISPTSCMTLFRNSLA